MYPTVVSSERMILAVDTMDVATDRCTQLFVRQVLTPMRTESGKPGK